MSPLIHLLAAQLVASWVISLTRGRAYIGVPNIGRVSWTEANSYCESEFSGNLATIESSIDVTFVRAAATAAGIPTNGNDINAGIWIGLHKNDSIENDSFKWIVDKNTETVLSLNYTNWMIGKPNGDGNCVEMISNHNNEWNDVSCDSDNNNKYFICDCNRYIGVSINLSWHDAEKYCINRYGTHLATIKTAQEHECGYQTGYQLKTDIDSSSNFNVWIGLYDNNDDSWLWTSDASAVFFYDGWSTRSREPRYRGGSCGEYSIKDKNNGYGWNDGMCNVTQYFLCDSPPSANSMHVSFFLCVVCFLSFSC